MDGVSKNKKNVVHRTIEISYILSRGESSKVSKSTALNCNLNPRKRRKNKH
jgi:hypothetical protein